MRRRPPPWWFVAATMFCTGWGGNQFTPLLSAYRERIGYSQLDVDIFLGAYVLGLVPGLLVASALSDHFGRRPVLCWGGALSVLGSGVLALGRVGGFGVLFAGRAVTGLAVGVAMAVGTSWVTELSRAPHESTALGVGARRSAVSLTLGFAAGPAVAGALVQWGPYPFVLPFAVHAALAAVALAALVAGGIETRVDRADGVRLAHRLRVPAAGHRRFVRVVLPMAPWVFGSAGIAYAVIPQVVGARLGRWTLVYATALTVATLVTGALVQPLARALNGRPGSGAMLVSMGLMTAGSGAAALTAAVGSPWLGVPVALLLGAAYGIAVVSGLLEIQRIAAPDELAGLTGVFYALAYLGFLVPAALAAFAHWFGYGPMLLVLTGLAAGSTLAMARGAARTAGPAGPAEPTSGPVEELVGLGHAHQP